MIELGTLKVGMTFKGRYLLEELVGSGGEGAVYRAFDMELGRDVAIKIPKPEVAQDDHAVKRFVNQGRIAARLGAHENIVHTYDAGNDIDGPYLVQEFIEGRSLYELVPVSLPTAIAITKKIADALSFIHQQGCVHCDVKSKNILIRPNGRPVLIDFGIARTQEHETRVLMSTVEYLAPELITELWGAQPFHHTKEADYYALGITLYEMITGTVPFHGLTDIDVIRQHRNNPVPSVAIENVAIRNKLDQIIAGLTAKKPEARCTTFGGLQNALNNMERMFVKKPPWSWLPRLKLLLPAVGIIVGLTGSILLWTEVFNQGQPSAQAVQVVIAKYRLAEKYALQKPASSNTLADVATGEALEQAYLHINQLKSKGQLEDLTVQQIEVEDVSLIDAQPDHIGVRVKETHTLQTFLGDINEKKTSSPARPFSGEIVYGLVNQSGQWKVQQERIVPLTQP